jgi:hypothetical protein
MGLCGFPLLCPWGEDTCGGWPPGEITWFTKTALPGLCPALHLREATCPNGKFVCLKSIQRRSFLGQSPGRSMTSPCRRDTRIWGRRHRAHAACLPQTVDRRGGQPSLPPLLLRREDGAELDLLFHSWINIEPTLSARPYGLQRGRGRLGFGRWRELCWKWLSLATGDWQMRTEGRGWMGAGHKCKRQETRQMEIFSSRETGEGVICLGEERIEEPWMKMCTRLPPRFYFVTFLCYWHCISLIFLPCTDFWKT